MIEQEIIQEVIAKMVKDKDKLFREMAIAEPYLYQFVYGMYKLPEADKDMMLGVAIGMYHMMQNGQ